MAENIATILAKLAKLTKGRAATAPTAVNLRKSWVETR